MIKTSNMLLDELKNYASPHDKISRMVKNGEIYPIVKGVYETNRSISPYLLAGSIYGPSYISFEYALSYYGMIPEAVYTVTSATCAKKKKKKYETLFGTFTYRDIPEKAFPFGIDIMKEGEYYYRIATPEKALCDKLYTMKPVGNAEEMFALLTENLRIDESELVKLNFQDIFTLAEYYHNTNVRKLCVVMRRLKNE